MTKHFLEGPAESSQLQLHMSLVKLESPLTLAFHGTQMDKS